MNNKSLNIISILLLLLIPLLLILNNLAKWIFLILFISTEIVLISRFNLFYKQFINNDNNAFKTRKLFALFSFLFVGINFIITNLEQVIHSNVSFDYWTLIFLTVIIPSIFLIPLGIIQLYFRLKLSKNNVIDKNKIQEFKKLTNKTTLFFLFSPLFSVGLIIFVVLIMVIFNSIHDFYLLKIKGL